uniref:Protein SPT2 homolog n=1 Tax=Strongyloides stercoralis TaxID=6248 RepID=A0A0K0EN94_STRER
MDDLLGEILGQVQATKKSEPVVKEYKSARRIAEEREIAQYEAEKRERNERNKLFELKAKERALDARIREAVKKNKGRVTARMAKEFGMDLLTMQERYGSDNDVLRKLQNEREKDSITTDWQCDRFAHGALKAQKLREQLAKNGRITAAAKTSKKAINFDEMTEDLTSRERKKIEVKKEQASIATKVSQGQNLSFIDILKKATLNKSEKGETSKPVEKINKIDKEKSLFSSTKSTSNLHDDKKNLKYSSNTQKVEKKYSSSEIKIKDDKKRSYDIPNKLDSNRHKTLPPKEDYFKKINGEKMKSQTSSIKNNIDSVKNVSKSISSTSNSNRDLNKVNGQKSKVSDIFKRPSERRKEMKELEKSSLTSKSVNNKKNKKNDIEMEKIRALQERERKKQEIFKAMKEVEMLRNKETEIYIKKKDKKVTSKDRSSDYKTNRNYDNSRKRSHEMFDDSDRKKSRRTYDNYDDEYDSEDSLADFIDDEFEEELPDRKTMKEALRGIAKNYDKARWRENEKRINDRDMVSSFREIDREERKSYILGYQEDLEEAKKGSEAL